MRWLGCWAVVSVAAVVCGVGSACTTARGGAPDAAGAGKSATEGEATANGGGGGRGSAGRGGGGSGRPGEGTAGAPNASGGASPQGAGGGGGEGADAGRISRGGADPGSHHGGDAGAAEQGDAGEGIVGGEGGESSVGGSGTGGWTGCTTAVCASGGTAGESSSSGGSAGTSGSAGETAAGGSASGAGGRSELPDPCSPRGCTDHIKSIAGDLEQQRVVVGDVDVETGFWIEVRETQGDEGLTPTRANLGVRVTLTSPLGADYDLVFGCDWECGDHRELDAPVHDLLGHSESIAYAAVDRGGSAPYGDGWDQSFMIHVGIVARTPARDACLPWTLTITTGPSLGGGAPWPYPPPPPPPVPWPTPPGPIQDLFSACP